MTKTKTKHIQPLQCTHAAASKSLRKPLPIKVKGKTTCSFTVSRWEAPNLKGKGGVYVGGESARVHGAMMVSGDRDDPKGCFVLARRAVHKGEVFSHTRVRFALRRKEFGASNPWEIQASPATAKAVCRQMALEGYQGWDLKDHNLFVGPARDGKTPGGRGKIYTEMTPPDDRTAEVLYRINSVQHTCTEGAGNVRLRVRLVRPLKDEGDNFAVPQVEVTVIKGIKQGEELLAQYDYRFSH